jgi:hypothetical protein
LHQLYAILGDGQTLGDARLQTSLTPGIARWCKAMAALPAIAAYKAKRPQAGTGSIGTVSFA